MDISSQPSFGSRQVHRLTQAARGAAITIAPVAVIAAAQLIFARQIVEATSSLDPEIDYWSVPVFRESLFEFHGAVALSLVLYWLLSAIIGNSRFPQIRGANIILGLSGVAFAIAMIICSVVNPIDLFEFACPVLGISDTMPQFGFDGFSDCELFARETAPMVLFGLPAILLIVSAVFRVVASHWRWNPSSR